MEIIIVGLGLIGGSIAKALKQNTSHRVLGMDINEDVLLDACSCRAIDGKATVSDLERADLVYLSIYPEDKREYDGCSLDEYAALVTERDILEGALTSVGGIYHACLHNALHERDDGMIAGLFKSAFFAIRAIDRLETGRTLRTRRELTEARPDDAWLINGSADGTFDEISERLFKWSSETLVKLGERV